MKRGSRIQGVRWTKDHRLRAAIKDLFYHVLPPPSCCDFCLTLSPIIKEVNNYSTWKQTNLGGTYFPFWWSWEEGYVKPPETNIGFRHPERSISGHLFLNPWESRTIPRAGLMVETLSFVFFFLLHCSQRMTFVKADPNETFSLWGMKYILRALFLGV